MQETFYHIPGCPFRIALVSDLHERPFDAVYESLRRRQPDLICVAGDFLYGVLPKNDLKLREAKQVLPFFAACAGIAPTFASIGNHEWLLTPGDAALLAESGAVLLDNAFRTLRLRDEDVVIGGLSSARFSEYRRLCTAEGSVGFSETANEASKFSHAPPETGWLSDFCAAPGRRILLCHHPEYYPCFLRALDVDLILSGHAHGGQIRLFGRGLFAPGQGLLPRLTSGVVDGRLVISRGLANTVIIPRVFNPPELVYIEE